MDLLIKRKISARGNAPQRRRLHLSVSDKIISITAIYRQIRNIRGTSKKRPPLYYFAVNLSTWRLYSARDIYDGAIIQFITYNLLVCDFFSLFAWVRMRTLAARFICTRCVKTSLKTRCPERQGGRRSPKRNNPFFTTPSTTVSTKINNLFAALWKNILSPSYFMAPNKK